MNERAIRIFKFIIAYKRNHDGNSPTIREIGRACGVSSTSMVRFYLDALTLAGKIEMAGGPGSSRSILVKGGKWVYSRQTARGGEVVS